MQLHYFRKRRIAELLEGAANDPYWNNVILLARAAASAGAGQTNGELIDYAPTPTTLIGVTNTSTFSPFTSGGTSLYFNGAVNDLVAWNPSDAFNFGAGDFTVELWFYTTVATVSQYLYGRANSFNGITLQSDSGNVRLYSSSTGTSWDIANGVSLGTVAMNAWNHIAVSRQGTSIRLFLNGVAGTVITSSASLYYDASQHRLGNGHTATYFTGYMTDVRVTKGVGRYGATFNLPTTQYTIAEDPYAANVSMLVNGGSMPIYDYSSSGTAFRSAGVTSTSYKKFNNPSLNIYNGISTVLEYDNDFVFGVGDFAIECWYRPTVTPSGVQMLVAGYGASPYPFGLDVSSTTLRLSLNNTVVASGTTSVTSGNWYHFAATRCNGIVRLFVNGQQVGSNTVNTTDISSAKQVCIGNRSDTWANPANGWFDDVRITKGVSRYVSNFNPLTASAPTTAKTTGGDSLFDMTTVLLPFNASNGSTNLDDHKGSSWTVSGASISTAQSVFGGSSLYLPGSSYAETLAASAANFRGDDFTVEFFLRWDPSLQTVNLFSTGPSYQPLEIQVLNGSLVANMSSNGSSWTIISGLSFGALTGNQWHHVAITRSSGMIRLFKDGVLVNSAYSSLSCMVNTSGIRLGARFATTLNAFKGYIDSLRITIGKARYVASFSVPTSTFPEYANFGGDPFIQDSLVFKTNTTHLASNNVIKDSSANAFGLTRVGNVSQGTFSPFGNAGYSALLTASSYHSFQSPANAAFDLGTGDFTIEAFAMFTGATGQYRPVICSHTSVLNGYAASWGFGLNNAEQLTFGCQTGNVLSPAQLWRQDRWYHLAVSRTSGLVKLFIDGRMVASATITGACGQNGLMLGAGYQNVWLDGYLSNVRVVKGVSLYTGDFTPPTSKLEAVPGTSYLALQDGFLVDRSSYNHTISPINNPPLYPRSPFFEAYDETTHGTSLGFDGTGDYLYVTGTQAALALGTGDFTLDGFVYRSVGATNQALVDFRPNATNGLYPFVYIKGTTLAFHTNSADQIVGTTTLAPGVWYHWACVRSSGVTRLYLNGVAQGSAYTDNNNYLCGANRPIIGLEGPASNSPMNGYLTNTRIIKGTALYTGDFQLPSVPMQNIAGTELLVRGTNAGIYDAAGRVNIETVGQVTNDLRTKKFVGAYRFDGVGDRLYALSPMPLLPKLSDFTVECWVNPATVASTQYGRGIWALSDNEASAALNRMMLRLDASGNITLYFAQNGAAAVLDSVGAGLCPLNAWTHIAVTRHQGNFRIFVNGTLKTSVTTQTTVSINAFRLLELGRSRDGTQPDFYGQIEDFRITYGKARYVTASHSPRLAFPKAA